MNSLTQAVIALTYVFSPGVPQGNDPNDLIQYNLKRAQIAQIESAKARCSEEAYRRPCKAFVDLDTGKVYITNDLRTE